MSGSVSASNEMVGASESVAVAVSSLGIVVEGCLREDLGIRAKRCLSFSATIVRSSAKVTFRDLRAWVLS